jgi:hypothetical protein
LNNQFGAVIDGHFFLWGYSRPRIEDVLAHRNVFAGNGEMGTYLEERLELASLVYERPKEKDSKPSTQTII